MKPKQNLKLNISEIFDEFVAAVENKNPIQAIAILTQNPTILEQRTSDNWACIQLAVYYEDVALLDKILEISTYEQINNHKYHPIRLAMDEHKNNSLQTILKYIEKIDLSLKFKQDDNLMHTALHNDCFDAVKKIHELEPHLFLELNSAGISPIALALDKKATEILNIFINNPLFQEAYNDLYLRKCIQHNIVPTFNSLYHFSTMHVDDIFQSAIDFQKPQIIAELIEFADFLPGEKQIQSLIELTCKKYQSDEENKSCGKIINYLFDIKIPFYKFINEFNQSAWMLSIQNGNNYVFRRLAKTNENVNHVDNFNCSPLSYAIAANNLSYVNSLLKKRANPNTKNGSGDNALIQAVKRGNVDIIRTLIPFINNINEFDSNEETALNIAVRQKKMDAVAALIWGGAEISYRPYNDIQQTTIHEITPDGAMQELIYQNDSQIDGFIALAKLGFNLNEKNSDGDYYLHHFIKNGDFSNFKSFLYCQVNPNMQNKEQETILMLASKKNNIDYFSFLLARFDNIDYNIKNQNGLTAIDICIQTHSLAKINLLLDKKPNLNSENLEKTLCYVAKYGQIERHLQYFSEKINIAEYRDLNFNSLLVHSIAGGNIVNFKFLIELYPKNKLLEKNKQNKSIQDIIEMIPEHAIQFEFKKILDQFSAQPRTVQKQITDKHC